MFVQVTAKNVRGVFLRHTVVLPTFGRLLIFAFYMYLNSFT